MIRSKKMNLNKVALGGGKSENNTASSKMVCHRQFRRDVEEINGTFKMKKALKEKCGGLPKKRTLVTNLSSDISSAGKSNTMVASAEGRIHTNGIESDFFEFMEENAIEYEGGMSSRQVVEDQYGRRKKRKYMNSDEIDSDAPTSYSDNEDNEIEPFCSDDENDDTDLDGSDEHDAYEDDDCFDGFSKGENDGPKSTSKRILTAEGFKDICMRVGINLSAVAFSPGQACVKREADCDLKDKKHAPKTPGIKQLHTFLGCFRSAVWDFVGLSNVEADLKSRGKSVDKHTKAKFKDAKRSYENEQIVGNKASGPTVKKPFIGPRILPFEVKDASVRSCIILTTVRYFDAILQSVSSDEPVKCTIAENSFSSSNHKLPVSPLRFPNYSKVRNCLKYFMKDLYALLIALQQSPSVEASTIDGSESGIDDLLLQVLLGCAHLNLLRWFNGHEREWKAFCRAVFRCWAFAQNHQQQLSSFVIIRKMAALLQNAEYMYSQSSCSSKSKARGGQPEKYCYMQEMQQKFLQNLLLFLQKASGRVGIRRTWRTASRLKLLVNEFVEIISVMDTGVAYRVAYQSIREMALTVRSAALGAHQKPLSNKAALANKVPTPTKSKTAYRSQRRQTSSEMLLISWSFVCTAEVFVASLGTHKVMHLLLFPLISLLSACVKLRLAHLPSIPFVLHLTNILYRAGKITDKLVPVGSHLLAIMTLLLKQHASAFRISNKVLSNNKLDCSFTSRTSKNNKKSKGNPACHQSHLMLDQTKMAYLELILKINQQQMESIYCIESLLSSLFITLTNHLAHLALSPSFPEAFIPVEASIKNAIKQSPKFTFTRQLEGLLQACEASSTKIKQLRLNMTDLPVGHLSVFDESKYKAMLPLLQLADRLKCEREQLLSGNFNAEVEAAKARKGQESPVILSKKQLKRASQKEKKKMRNDIGNLPMKRPTMEHRGAQIQENHRANLTNEDLSDEIDEMSD